MTRSFFLLFFIFAVVSISERPARAEEKAYDFLIKDALIYDGTSPRGFKGDVAIHGPYIAAVDDNIPEAEAREVIQAEGRVLAPGFIDAHTHSDFNPLIYPGLRHKLLQGVTTEIVGNCGMSAAPILGPHAEHIRSVWAREGVVLPQEMNWRTFQEYREALESAGLDNHMAALVGHGNIRSAVMGFTPAPASQSQIEDMKKLVGEAMKDGAYGISFGLIYLPGTFAKEEEITELCREAARHRGVCAFHMRSESSMLLEAIGEAVRIGERASAQIQISHLKAAGKKNWDKIEKAFHLIDDARTRGQRILADAYPYTASFAELGVILPEATFEREDRLSLFKDLFKRDQLLKELKDYYEKRKMNWEAVMIASAREDRYLSYEGKTMKQLSKELNRAPEQVLVDLLADNQFEVSAFSFSQSQEVVDRVIAQPYVVLGSDSIADGSRKPHPRAFGTFPRAIRRYTKEEKILNLGEMIRKMTSMVANHFGLEGRGVIATGYYADLVLFDPNKIKDRATYELPSELSEGIEWVFLNGEAVIYNGELLAAKKGHVLVKES